MTPAEIHSRLKEKFPSAVGEWQEPKAGDPCILLEPQELHEVCLFLKSEPGLEFDYLKLITGVDRGDKLSSVYHLYSYKHQHALVLRADVERAEPKLPSVADIWPAADWLERECFDMLGIVYQGHPDLRRILLPLDWEGYPLRKDYKQPQSYHGIKNE